MTSLSPLPVSDVTWRIAVPLDLADVLSLTHHFAEGYLDDRDEIGDAQLIEAVNHGRVIIVERLFQCYGIMLIEALPYADQAVLHGMMVPKRMRSVLAVLPKMIKWAMDEFKLHVLYADVMRYQKQAIRVLLRLNFRHIGSRDHAGLHKGKRYDIECFELLKGQEHRPKHHPGYIKGKFGITRI